MRGLVVEDQAELADDIAEGLRDQGIGADVAYDGTAGIEKALMNSYNVVVLDRDLPAVDGGALPDADRGGGGRRPGTGPHPRRRRLPGQAVCVRGTRRPGPVAGPAR